MSDKIASELEKIFIGGKLNLIKVDLKILDGTVLVEKTTKDDMYNFYFPKDVQNKIYVLATVIPCSVLDSYFAERINKNIKERNEKISDEDAVNILNDVLTSK